MAKSKNAAVQEQVPFDGLSVTNVAEVDIQQVNGSVWVFIRRTNQSIVRVWIGNPDRTVETPLRVTVEAEDW